MDNTVSLPPRFVANSKPHEGLVAIKDSQTGREGEIRLACYQSVANLLHHLFATEDDHREAAEVRSAAEAIFAEAPPELEETSQGEERSTPVEGVSPEPAPAKKRGRPAKEAIPVEESTSIEEVAASAVEPATEAPAPKKRGRPKKVVEAAEASAEAPAPKKRGRPKKSDAEKAETTRRSKQTQKDNEGRMADFLAEDMFPLSTAEAAPQPAKGKKVGRPKKQESKPAKAASIDPANLEPLIEHSGFKLVLQEDKTGYDIVLDNGGEFGRVELVPNSRAAKVIPKAKDREPSNHASLVAARAKVDALVHEND